VRWSRATREAAREGSLSVLLALEVFVIFLAAPARAMGISLGPGTVEFVLLTMVVAIILAAPGRWTGGIAVTALLLGAVATLMRETSPSALTYWLSATASLVTVGMLSWVISLAVYGPGHISAHRIRGAIVLYLNIALAFVVVYRLIEELTPGSFRGVAPAETRNEQIDDLIYFSVVTLSTAGFGDVVPLNRIARSMASLEAVLGQLYIATFLGRLITLNTARAQHIRDEFEERLPKRNLRPPTDSQPD
jgi:hypothetical protein